MTSLFILFVLIIFCFGFVILFGAPYLPTLRKERLQALELLNLKAGETLLELGCGDGRLLKLAAQRGIISIGYELNPIMVVVAKLINIKYRKNVTIKWANFWAVKLPKSDAIYVFLLDKYMNKLDIKIRGSKVKNIKLLSYGFKIPNKKYVKKTNALYLYKY